VESDATSPSLERSASFEVTPSVTQGDDQVAEQDADNDEDQGQVMGNVQESIAVEKTRRNSCMPSWLITNMIVVYALPITEEAIQSTYREAKISSESKMWKDAMIEKISSLHKNNTWELLELPKGKKIIGCQWAFVKKQRSSDGYIECYNWSKGYAQREGIDYNEIFSPVVKYSSIQILLALVAQYKLELDQLNVKTAFLHTDLEEKIYMSQLTGFKTARKENMVCKLKKLLYGLKQSPRQWYKRFDSFIRGKRYIRSHYDPCVYYNKLPGEDYVYLLLYVDDMLIASQICYW